LETFRERYFKTAKKQFLYQQIGRLSLGELKRRRYDELTSGLAEALPGIVKTEYSFEQRGGRLVAQDGEPIEDLLWRAYDNDLAMAKQDEFYAQFLPQRSYYELQELYEMEAMARGETSFNTIITFSPYSQEYDTSPENHNKLKEAKQMPQWKRAMIRVAHWDGYKLHIATRSIDNSDVALLHETAKRYLQYKFKARNSTEMLGERIHLTLEPKMAQLIPDAISRTADSILAERLGGEWLQGRPAKQAQDMQKYVESNVEIVQNLLATEEQLARRCATFEEYVRTFDQEIYNHLALLKQRLEYGVNQPLLDIMSASIAAGEISRANGEIFSMCGYILSPNISQNQIALQNSFESLMRLVGKEVKCPACKKMVVISTRKLIENRLACRKCGLEVDACTGKVYKKSKAKTGF
jgi:hypothetical protein